MPMSLDQFRQMLDSPSMSKADLVTVLQNCRAKHDEERVAEVLGRLNARWPGWDKPVTKKGGSRETIARFKGKETLHPSARAAYVWLVERFVQTFPSVFQDVRWETTGFVAVGRRLRKEGAARNYFARSPAGLFLQSPQLADNGSNFARLTNGWFVNLNLNTVENFDILCRLGYVCGLKYEDDWDWVVLDPSQALSEKNARRELASRLLNELIARLAPSPNADA